MKKPKFNPAAPAQRLLLLTALGALAGMGVTSQAVAGAAIGVCDGPSPSPACQTSTVTDTVTGLGGGQFLYEYTVNNTSIPEGDLIVDWELPWFPDSGITDIQSPAGWAWAIEDIGIPNFFTGWGGVADWQTPGDPFYEGPDSPYTTATKVLHWYTCASFGEFGEQGCFGEDGRSGNPIYPNSAPFPPIGTEGSLGGFSFQAVFDETPAPYQASWARLPVQTGDPAFPLGGIPASPMALGMVPVPGTLPLVLLGAIGAYAISRRRKHAS